MLGLFDILKHARVYAGAVAEELKMIAAQRYTGRQKVVKHPPDFPVFIFRFRYELFDIVQIAFYLFTQKLGSG